MGVDDGSGQNLGLYAHWITRHASLKYDFTYAIMSWLKYFELLKKRSLGPWIANLSPGTWVDDVLACGYGDTI